MLQTSLFFGFLGAKMPSNAALAHAAAVTKSVQVLKPLTFASVPVLHDEPSTPVGLALIRSKCPRDYQVPAHYHKKGGHNAVYLAKHKDTGHTAVIFRKNVDTDQRDGRVEQDWAAELSYGIEFYWLGIGPAIYDYGFCATGRLAEDGTPAGYYWQVVEKFDMSLKDLLRKHEHRLCGPVLHEVENQLVKLFKRMASAHIFCMDIHARNVVVREGPSMTLKLIDFDNSFCVTNSRIRFSSDEEVYKGHHVDDMSPGSGKPVYLINYNNLVIALLLTFSSNTHEVCGNIPFFRTVLNDMLAEKSPYLEPDGGRPNLHRVLKFLTISEAQSSDTTLRVMQHWSHFIDDEQASAAKLASIVLGRGVDNLPARGKRYAEPFTPHSPDSSLSTSSSASSSIKGAEGGRKRGRTGGGKKKKKKKKNRKSQRPKKLREGKAKESERDRREREREEERERVRRLEVELTEKRRRERREEILRATARKGARRGYNKPIRLELQDWNRS